MPPSSTGSQHRKKARAGSEEGGDRIIDGVRFPREERQIDQLGFETTKHSLHFHGADWDIPLTQRRDDLTKYFITGAATATDEPTENIQNVRFVMSDGFLHVKFTVRHKAHVSSKEVQSCLAKYDWKLLHTLYEPRTKKHRVTGQYHVRQDTTDTVGGTRGQRNVNLSFFGRVREPAFHDGIDHDEEPVAHEGRQAAKVQRTTSRLVGMRML